MSRQHRSAAKPPEQRPVLECLSQEHRHIAALLGLLEQRMGSRRKLSTADLYLLADVIGYLHDYPDHVHHPTENLLFDHLLQRRPDLEPELAGLRQEHEQLGAETLELLDALERAIAAGAATQAATQAATNPTTNPTSNPTSNPTNAQAALRTRIRQFIHSQRAHMEREGRNVFAVATHALRESDWRALERRTRLHDDPLFGAGVQPRQRLLFEYLAHPQRRSSMALLASGMDLQERLVGVTAALEAGAGEAASIYAEAARSLFGEARALLLGERHYADPWQRLIWPWHYGRLVGHTAWQGGGALLKASGKTARDVWAAALRRQQPEPPLQ